MAAKDYLKELDRRYQELAVKNANGSLTRNEVLELLDMQEGRKRVGKKLLF